MVNTKTIDPEKDYADIDLGVSAIRKTIDFLDNFSIRCDVGHPQRFWEYGSGVQALVENLPVQTQKILDVGAGWSPFGPCLVKEHDADVTECEIDRNCYENRVLTNALLKKNQLKEIRWLHTGVDALPQEQFDMVSCISVLEHVHRNIEFKAWQNLAERVRPGGILYMTVDVVPKPGAYVFDNLRNINYLIEDIYTRLEFLVHTCNMQYVGNFDMEWHGEHVHDYSFARILMKRKK